MTNPVELIKILEGVDKGENEILSKLDDNVKLMIINCLS